VAFQMEGVLHKVFETEQKSERFQAREFVVETQEQYPQFVKFQLVQEKCELADSYNEGDRVRVHFDLRGREWNGKYFTNLNAWRMEAADAAASPGAQTSPSSTAPATAAVVAPSTSTSPSTPAPQADFDDDIPF